VASFVNADPVGTIASYTATINWGDGATSSGTISDSGHGTFLVGGSHTYAEAGTEPVTVHISHVLGNTTSATANSSAVVTNLGFGSTQNLEYWRGDGDDEEEGDGQALIRNFNGGPTHTELSHWLAATFPKLFGAQAGTHNLTGMTNDQVAAFLRSEGLPEAYQQVLAAALNVYASTLSLGGAAGEAAGFQVTLGGLGAASFSVGRDGAAFGVADNSSLTVSQMLAKVNDQAVNGVLYPNQPSLQDQAEDEFEQVVNRPGQAGIREDQTAGIDFWHGSQGQTLLASFNGGSTHTELSSWLVATFPNLYGAGAGSHNLTGKSNAQVAAFFQTLWTEQHDNPDVQMLAAALNVYASTASLGGAQGSAGGFQATAEGLGASSFDVGNDGAAFGVANGTTLNVYQLLRAVNQQAVGGVLWNSDAHLRDLAEDLFEHLNHRDD
jgi:hypothetical protein